MDRRWPRRLALLAGVAIAGLASLLCVTPLHSAASVGSWSFVNSPNTSDRQSNQLLGVACINSNDCWAVGAFFSGLQFQTLTEHFDGNLWARVSSPSTGAGDANHLYAVSCVSSTDCWAVGSHTDSTGAAHTLIEQYTASAWIIVSSPDGGGQGSFLYGVSCLAANDCWAVGTHANPSLALIEHFDGTTWAVVSSPNPTPQSGYLASVSCVPPSVCWAVGNYDGPAAVQTLIEQYDGTNWTIASSPNTQGALPSDHLSGVSCTTAQDCWAVGSAAPAFPRQSPIQTLIEHYNGAGWAIVSSPNPSASANLLGAVSCTAATDCWAVGAADGILVEQYAAGQWTAYESTAASERQLTGVACVGSDGCWAVGWYGGTFTDQTRIAQFTPAFNTLDTLDAYGALHASPGSPSNGQSATFGFKIARGVALRAGGTSGYVLDGWGGIHPFGGAPRVASATYWLGRDLARGLVLRADGQSGYLLDAWGGIHPFGGAPSISQTGYWLGWDIARAIVLSSDGNGGYVLDCFGGVHPFGNAPFVGYTGYWAGWDIARSLVLTPGPSHMGYVLDGWGGIHSFGGAPELPQPAGGYFPGNDVVRAIGVQ